MKVKILRGIVGFPPGICRYIAAESTGMSPFKSFKPFNRSAPFKTFKTDERPASPPFYLEL